MKSPMDHKAESGGKTTPSAVPEYALERLFRNEAYMDELLRCLTAFAWSKVPSKHDAEDLAMHAIEQILTKQSLSSENLELSVDIPERWTAGEQYLYNYCRRIILNQVCDNYKKSKRQESGLDNKPEETLPTDAAESTSTVANPWVDTPVEVLVSQDNWAEVQTLLPKADTPSNQLLLKVADQIAQSNPVRLASPTFSEKDISQPAPFALELSVAPLGVSNFLWRQFSAQTRLLLGSSEPASPPSLARSLATELNKIINGPSIYSPELFPKGTLSKLTAELLDVNPNTDERICLQRLLLEDAYPKYLSQRLHYFYEEGLARRKTGWANRELAAALGTSETEIVNAKRQLETILAPWVWSRFKELLPQDGRPWLALVNEAERPNIPADWKSTFARTHSLVVTDLLDMGQEVVARFHKWFGQLHRTVKTEQQPALPHSPDDENRERLQRETDPIPLGRALDRQINRFKQNILESEQT